MSKRKIIKDTYLSFYICPNLLSRYAYQEAESADREKQSLSIIRSRKEQLKIKLNRRIK